MKYISKFTLLTSALALTAFSLTMPGVFTANAYDDQAGCIVTDVKGSFQYSGNHLSSNPVNGIFENIAANENCSDDIYVHIFGSNIDPETDGWFASQVHVATQTYTIPQNGNLNVQVSVPQSDYCWYQVDATRTSEVRIPPVYHGNDMIDYVFVKNAACEITTTPTPTATPSATPTVTVTPTSGPTTTPTPQGEVGSASSTKTVESVQATLASTTMAKTGLFDNLVAKISLVTGMIVSALGALSYAKDKKAARSF